MKVIYAKRIYNVPFFQSYDPYSTAQLQLSSQRSYQYPHRIVY